jgi:tRNA nucleotidyltransferase (CCA-adding enzyme)
MADDNSIENLAAALRDAYPELATLDAAGDDPAYLVGGGVRDLLLGRGRSANLDIVVEGDAMCLAARLGGEVLEHERFGTATVFLAGLEVDVAAARTERYPYPGALPEVEGGAGIEADLERRDFTVNAMAIPLADPRLVDPLGGRADLEAGRLRVLHERSFVDDPTRALRAARYASRLGFGLEPATEALLREADLEAVSGDRREAELRRLAAEAQAVRGFELLSEWGLIELRQGGLELASSAAALLDDPMWSEMAPRELAIRAAALDPPGGEQALAEAVPATPSEAVALAAAVDPVGLVLARALGAEWLDTYLRDWRHVALEIDGADLIEAGVPEGPAVGRGLAEALRMKLDRELEPGRAEELEAAVAAARSAGGLA